MRDPGYELLFMPWAGLGQQYDCGPFTFTSWAQMQISDAGIKAYLDQYFSRHLDHLGRPVDTVTIVRHSSHDFQPAPFGSHEHPMFAVNALVFSIIGPTVAAAVTGDNQNLTPPTADRYECHRQNFRLGEDSVSVKVGSSVHAARIQDLTFSEPWDLGGGASFPDKDLLTALGKLMDPGVSAAHRDSLFRSLDWFRIAHIGGETVSEFSRVVMMATAFETLFQLPRNYKKWELTKAIDSRLRRPETKTGSVVDPQQQTHIVGHPALWVRDFFELRNKVAHGDALILNQLLVDRWITHLVIADVVFWQCVKYSLYQRRLLGGDIHALQLDPANAPAVRLLEDQLLGFDTHEIFKWVQ